MDIFLQQIVNGLVQGSIYALVALGYTMVYGIMGLINFAHGEVVMIGTLVTITVTGTLIKAGMPVALAGLAGVSVAVLVCIALGWSLERIAYRPLRGSPRLTPLITAIGMSIVLQNLAMIIWGRNYMTFPPFLPKINFEVAGAHFTAVQVAIVAVSALTMGGLLLLVYRTKLGGAMAGGLLLGLIEALGAGYIGDLTGGFLGSHYQDIFAFIVLIGVLMFRPSGLFGEKSGDRA
jgi:branched-chain amino acid transport system permease protein